jgi:hypothetical protein
MAEKRLNDNKSEPSPPLKFAIAPRAVKNPIISFLYPFAASSATAPAHLESLVLYLAERQGDILCCTMDWKGSTLSQLSERGR